MGKAKREVSNKSRPEGSICTFHLHREITYFCSHYFKDECSLSNNSSGTILVMETMLSRRGCQCWTKSDVLLGHVETILLPTPSGLLLMCMSLSIAQKLNHISSKWYPLLVSIYIFPWIYILINVIHLSAYSYNNTLILVKTDLLIYMQNFLVGFELM